MLRISLELNESTTYAGLRRFAELTGHLPADRELSFTLEEDPNTYEEFITGLQATIDPE